jgi:hypothetical protein
MNNFSYPVLSRAAANQILSELRNGGARSPLPSYEIEGDGNYVLEDIDLGSLLKKINDLWVKTKEKQAEFESEACSLFHSRLSNLPILVATDSMFWQWFNFIPEASGFAEFVAKRYSVGKGKGFNAEGVNFGIGDPFMGLYGRLWYRGFRQYDESLADKYEYSRRGYIDFWDSHIIDQEFSWGDPMCRAFIKHIYPISKQISGHSMALIRELPKKIRARHATCAFETLSEEECLQLLVQLSAEIIDDSSNAPAA